MGKAIGESEFRKAVYGKTGYIYIARNATQVIYIVEGGNTYAASTAGAGGIIVDPAPVWWAGAIDFAGGFADYRAYGMIPGVNPPYPNKKTLNVITSEQMAILAQSAA